MQSYKGGVASGERDGLSVPGDDDAPVGLIQHEEAHAVQHDLAALHQVFEPAGRGLRVGRTTHTAENPGGIRTMAPPCPARH